MRIELTMNGEGTLECVSFDKFRCVGKKGMSYPKTIYINPTMRGTKQNPHKQREVQLRPVQ